MIEHFNTLSEAKARRNVLRDESAFFEVPSFLHRYTKQSQEDGIHYRDRLYTVLEGVTFPADIDWPEIPVPQTLDDYNASLPKAEAPEA
jgi:hypothetical protein